MTINNSVDSRQSLKATGDVTFNTIKSAGNIDFTTNSDYTIGGIVTTGTITLGSTGAALALGNLSIFQDKISSTTGKINFSKNIDFAPATMSYSIGAGLSANTLTLGANNTPIVIPGSLQVAELLYTPVMIIGDLFPTTTSLSVSNTTTTDILNSSTLTSKTNGVTITDIGGGQGFGFTFSQNGIYIVSYTVSFRPATVVSGSVEMYLIANNGSADTGRRQAYCSTNWSVGSTFPVSLQCSSPMIVTDNTLKYRMVVFQNTGATQTLGMTATNAQTSGFSIIRQSAT